jgi:hypothetical protein
VLLALNSSHGIHLGDIAFGAAAAVWAVHATRVLRRNRSGAARRAR